jgi:DHA1 family inner membrane transport protein
MTALIAMLAMQAVVMAAMYVVAPYPVPMLLVVMVWGALNFSIGTAVQTRILRWTADAPNLASSLIPSGFNVGIAIAAFVGATMLNAGLPYRTLPLVGVAAMAVAVVAAVLSKTAERRSGSRPPLPSAAA